MFSFCAGLVLGTLNWVYTLCFTHPEHYGLVWALEDISRDHPGVVSLAGGHHIPVRSTTRRPKRVTRTKRKLLVLSYCYAFYVCMLHVYVTYVLRNVCAHIF